jgi:cytochrome P450
MTPDNKTSSLPLPPLVKGSWPMGSAQFFADDPLALFDNAVPEYGDVFRLDSIFFHFLTEFDYFIAICHPDGVKHVMQDNNRNYIKSFGYRVLENLVGKGLLTSEGDFWRKQRRLIQPHFHKERLSSFTQIMTDGCEEVLARWRKLPEGSEVNVSKDMMTMTLKVVCRSMFSTDVGQAMEVVSREFDVANELMNDRIVNPQTLPLWFPTSRNRREKQAYASLKKVVSDIIAQRRAAGDRHDDLLAMLMETEDADTGERMTDQQIQDEVITMFLAGHETTAVAMAWLFHALNENPEVQQKTATEARKALNGRIPNLTDLRELPYTRMVIDETLRLYPPAWVIGRHSLEEDVVGGFRIPANSNCMIPVYHIHRDKRFWDEAEQFIPERFSPEQSEKRHKFIYFPFGGGPRQCIGNNFALMEMQLSVPMILQEFCLRSIEGRTIHKEPLITMRQAPNLVMHLERRPKG